MPLQLTPIDLVITMSSLKNVDHLVTQHVETFAVRLIVALPLITAKLPDAAPLEETAPLEVTLPTEAVVGPEMFQTAAAHRLSRHTKCPI
jgi:hypothetical protein